MKTENKQQRQYQRVIKMLKCVIRSLQKAEDKQYRQYQGPSVHQ